MDELKMQVASWVLLQGDECQKYSCHYKSSDEALCGECLLSNDCQIGWSRTLDFGTDVFCPE